MRSLLFVALLGLSLSGCQKDEPLSPAEQAERAQQNLAETRQEAAELIAEAEEDAVETIIEAKEDACARVQQSERKLQQKLDELATEPTRIVKPTKPEIAPENLETTTAE